MSNRYNGLQRGSRKRARLHWLQAQPDLLAVLPSASDDVSDQGRAALMDAHQRMVKVGLYSATSEARASRWGIRLLVSELRGQRATNALRYAS